MLNVSLTEFSIQFSFIFNYFIGLEIVMAASLAMKIKDSFRQFSFSRPVITEQNCAEYLINELNNRFKSVPKNSVYRIDEKLITAANLYCSITKNELEVIFNRKFITVNLDKITNENLQKFQCLLDHIKNVKNTEELNCSVSKNISDLIALKSMYANQNEEFEKIEENENVEVEKKKSIIIKESYPDDEEGLTAKEMNRIYKYLEHNRPLEELEEFKSEKKEYFIKAYQEIKENRDKKNKKSFVTEQDGQLIRNKTTELTGLMVDEKGTEENIISMELKHKDEIKNTIERKEASSSSFWQKLNQKTTQFLAISWGFIKSKLIGFLLPGFFSTKIN